MRIDVDLYSDTVTRPTPEMRRFMCDAEVGDEQKGEDPTVNLLQRDGGRAPRQGGRGLPAVRHDVQRDRAARARRPGDEVLAHRTAHPIHFETGGPAALAGVNVRAIDGPRGQFDAAAVEAAVRSPRPLLAAEPARSGSSRPAISAAARSGRCERIQAVAAVATRHGLATHMDGARLMNAVVASGVSARDYAAPFDSAWIDFTKGLGRAGRRGAGRLARVHRRGVAAASSRWAARCARPGSSRPAASTRCATTSKRLAEDHANARRLAEGLAGLPGRRARPGDDRDEHRLLRADRAR